MAVSKKAPAAKAAPKAAKAKGKSKQAPARKPLTQAALVDHLASKAGTTKVQVKAVLDELAAVAAKEAAVGFTLPGIGKLVLRETQERQGRNPATGQTITIPAGKKVKFNVAAPLKRAVLGE